MQAQGKMEDMKEDKVYYFYQTNRYDGKDQ